MNLNDSHTIFFLGIGGIGMSALAKYMLHQGKTVYGYDRVLTDLTRELESEGAIISDDDQMKLDIMNIDLVIYTPAIKNDNLLYQIFETAKIPMIKRAQALGMITQNKITIAVAGSHGKTTVSSMVTVLLKESGIDVSAFLGGIATNYNSNFLIGNSDYVIVEADEYDRSFHHLHPNMIIITSIDTDHLDIYQTRENIVESFQVFVNQSKPNSTLILNDKITDNLKFEGTETTYGFSDKAKNRIEVIQLEPMNNQFKISGQDELYTLRYNGLHNIENATAALTLGKLLNLNEKTMAKALKEYRGVKRRFELIYDSPSTIYIDDYAHHPSEIKALVEGVKSLYPNKKITLIFQPHLYSRTRDLADEFAHELSQVNQVYLLPIYPARELPIEGVTSELIADKMKTSVEIIPAENIVDVIKENKPEILLTVGAGDISDQVKKLKKILSE